VTKTRAIEFVAEVRKIQTMVDGSVNVILNLPEHCREQAKVLIDWHHEEVHGILALDHLDGD
jgi:hypothetical protein